MRTAPGLLLGAAGGIALVTVASRAVGAGRVAVLSRKLGTSCVGDVYTAANAVPNVVFELVAGGALAALVVPVLAGRERARGELPQQVVQPVQRLQGRRRIVERLSDRPLRDVDQFAQPVGGVLRVHALGAHEDQPRDLLGPQLRGRPGDARRRRRPPPRPAGVVDRRRSGDPGRPGQN